VIGVNTAIFSPNGGSIGIGFAIPAETVKAVVSQLKEHGAVTRGWIGVQIQPVTRDIADSIGLARAEGALVADAQPDSPAAKAGIVSGDVIAAVNGERVRDARDLAKKISTIAPGSSVRLGILRQGQERTVAVALGEFPKEQHAKVEPKAKAVPGSDVPHLGLTLAPANNDGSGVVVTRIDPDGVGAEHGFRNGDVILEIGGKAVSNPADVHKAFAEAQAAGKRTLLMRVKSGDATKFVAIPVGAA
jgi:serine protease Do